MAKAQFKPIRFGGLSNNLAESVESGDNAWASFNCWHDNGILEGMKRYKVIGQRSTPNAADVGYGLGYGKSTGNEIQKLTVTGSPTGGTVKLTIVIGSDTYSDAGTLAWNATADDMYAYLQTLDNAGTVAFRPGDLSVTGGPWPGTPIEVEYTGRYANTDMNLLVLATNSLTGGSSPTVTIAEKKKGGSNEVYYVVVQPSGSGDATLYAVTSSDGFETTTWTSLATDFAASDWFFEQYQDKMFMANSVDGLKYVYIGSSSISADPPSPPAMAPTYGGPFTNFEALGIGTGATYAQTGFASAPTMAASGNAIKVTLTGNETGNAVTITATLGSDPDLSAKDVGDLFITTTGLTIQKESMRVTLTNADGSPVDITPVAYDDGVDNGVGSSHAYYRRWHLAGNVRYSRDNIHKVKIAFTFDDAVSADVFYIYANIGSNWMNDTLALAMGPPPDPVKSPIEYGMTYVRVSDMVESRMSPTSFSPSVPTNFMGDYLSVNGRGTSELSTSDLQWFYRKHKASGNFHRIPNLWTKNGSYQLTDYGVTNDPTGASDGQYDHWMEYEIVSFPKFENTGFPPISTGANADVLGVWKQCLCVGSGPLAYISWVGQPLKYETIDSVTDPEQFPDVGVTEYVSDNRSEPVQALKGQDSLYAVTLLSSYAKVGNSPATASVFRRLPGSRGCVGKRACFRYGGGILNAAQDGLWFYNVNTGFKGEDSGSLYEREETGGDMSKGIPGVRKSYQRLVSELQSLTLSGTYTSGDTFTITVSGKTTQPIPCTAIPYTVQQFLEDMDNVSPGEIEVFGDDLLDAGNLPGGKMYFRFLGRWAGTNVDAMTVTLSSGSQLSATVATESIGGTGNDTIIVEHNDEYWLFNDRNYLVQSRNRRWVEGTFRDKMKAVHPDRTRGLVALTGTGSLVKFGDSLSTDNGGEVKWFYETPWMTGPRSRVIGANAVTRGAVAMRILSDDGAGSVDVYGRPNPHKCDVALESGKYTPLPATNLPGIRHKLILSGIDGKDQLMSLGIMVQGDGGDASGS